jgi:hypothetical protein
VQVRGGISVSDCLALSMAMHLEGELNRRSFNPLAQIHAAQKARSDFG